MYLWLFVVKVHLLKICGGPSVIAVDSFDERVASISCATFQPWENSFNSDAVFLDLVIYLLIIQTEINQSR